MNKNLKQKFIIIIFGPTAVGKSSFAESIACKIPSQIINCDIGQFYTPLSIGTAKPDWKSSDIKQHLFDIIDEPKYFDVCQYRNMLFKQAEKIWQDNEIPILVGGSGFYLKSLFFPPVDQCLQTEEEIPKEIGDENLWEALHKIDPKRAAEIDKNDTYRIKRALNIWEKTGKKPSEFVPTFDFPSNFLFIFLNRDRKELYERINQRVLQMIDEGLVPEVEALLGTEWESFLHKKKIIGYNAILEYLQGNQTKENLQRAIESIQQRTRNYAKRQITFWKSFEKQLKEQLKEIKSEDKNKQVKSKIESIDLTFFDLDLYIKQLLIYLKPLF